MPEAVEGLDQLNKKLIELGTVAGGKMLRASARSALNRNAKKQIEAAAPRGKRPHVLYNGRLVSPGYASRSIVLRSSGRKFVAGAVLFMKPDAFYAIKFVESGTKPHWIPHKRNRLKGAVVRLPSGRVLDKVKHPGTKARPWFAKTFRKRVGAIEKGLAVELTKRMHKAVKS